MIYPNEYYPTSSFFLDRRGTGTDHLCSSKRLALGTPVVKRHTTWNSLLTRGETAPAHRPPISRKDDCFWCHCLFGLNLCADRLERQSRKSWYSFDGCFVMLCHQNRTGFVQVTILGSGTICASSGGMTWQRRIRHTSIILSLYGIGILEGVYLPRYGIEWMLGAIGATAVLSGFWLRKHWDA